MTDSAPGAVPGPCRWSWPCRGPDALVVGHDDLACCPVEGDVHRVEVGGQQALVLHRRRRAAVTVDGQGVVPPDADQDRAGVGHRDGVRVAAEGGARQRVDVDGLLDRGRLGVDQRDAVVVRVGHHQRAVRGQVLGGRLQADPDRLDLVTRGQVDLGHRAGGGGAGDLVGHDGGAGRVVGVLPGLSRAAALVGHEGLAVGQHHLAGGVAHLDHLGQLIGRRVDDAEFVDHVERDVELAAVRAERHAGRPVGHRARAGGEVVHGRGERDDHRAGHRAVGGHREVHQVGRSAGTTATCRRRTTAGRRRRRQRRR